ncbi:MAG: DUF6168 family protein [Pricia sp.]
MLKHILQYILFFGLLFIVGFYAHENILRASEKTLGFSLRHIYIFHALFSFSICTLLLVLSKLPNLAPQLGFLYLGGFLLKFLAFAVVFQNIIIGEAALSIVEAVSLMVPIALFLGLEVYFVAKILRVMDTA